MQGCARGGCDGGPAEEVKAVLDPARLGCLPEICELLVQLAGPQREMALGEVAHELARVRGARDELCRHLVMRGDVVVGERWGEREPPPD